MPELHKAARQGPMKVELFLDKINQEMIRTVGSAAGCDLYASWTKSCCILDFSLSRPEDQVVLPANLKGLLLRKEPEGAMMWDPRTGAVYKLSESAYHALIDLDSGLSELETARRHNVSLKELKGLTRSLEKISRTAAQ